jgi:hypothetical protein
MKDPPPVFLLQLVPPFLKGLERIAKLLSFLLQLLDAALIGGHELLAEGDFPL